MGAGGPLEVALLSARLDGRTEEVVAKRVLRAAMEDFGVHLTPVEPAELERVSLPALLLLTGGTEAAALAVAERLDGPLLIVSHGGRNALPAALETVAALQARGRKAKLVHLSGSCGQQMAQLVRVRDLAHAFRSHHVGLVGGSAPWLVASAPEVGLVEQKTGLRVSELPMSEVLMRLPVSPPRVPQGECPGLDAYARVGGTGVLSALEMLIAERSFSAISISCFALLEEKITACWALAALADRGIPAGCEGDLPALLALIAAQELSGKPGFLANPADIEPASGRVIMAHCTVPLSLTRGHRLRTHFESGLGLAIEGCLEPGPYTLARFGGKRLEQGMFVEGAVSPENPGREDLCRTQVVFAMPPPAAERLLATPLGNHHVLIPGHHSAVLNAFHALYLA